MRTERLMRDQSVIERHRHVRHAEIKPSMRDHACQLRNKQTSLRAQSNKMLLRWADSPPRLQVCSCWHKVVNGRLGRTHDRTSRQNISSQDYAAWRASNIITVPAEITRAHRMKEAHCGNHFRAHRLAAGQSCCHKCNTVKRYCWDTGQAAANDEISGQKIWLEKYWPDWVSSWLGHETVLHETSLAGWKQPCCMEAPNLVGSLIPCT